MVDFQIGISNLVQSGLAEKRAPLIPTKLFPDFEPLVVLVRHIPLILPSLEAKQSKYDFTRRNHRSNTKIVLWLNIIDTLVFSGSTSMHGCLAQALRCFVFDHYCVDPDRHCANSPGASESGNASIPDSLLTGPGLDPTVYCLQIIGTNPDGRAAEMQGTV